MAIQDQLDFTDMLGQGSKGEMELFPAVWMALEALSSPIAGTRRNGIDELVRLNAPRFSSLVAYVLATRISDPDISIRINVIKALGDVLAPDDEGKMAPEIVRQHLVGTLTQIRQRPIFALLEATAEEDELDQHVARLLNACPQAGNTLIDILSDRKISIKIRKQAAHFLGSVGYLDAIPSLERLITRLQSRLNGQHAMPFAGSAILEDSELLPVVLDTLTVLQAP